MIDTVRMATQIEGLHMFIDGGALKMAAIEGSITDKSDRLGDSDVKIGAKRKTLGPDTLETWRQTKFQRPQSLAFVKAPITQFSHTIRDKNCIGVSKSAVANRATSIKQ